jgi:LuxR family maltose regulon positive regulatory protein
VLVAPAGYGKTTLLGQFARETSRPVVWLTLSPDEGEVLMLERSIAEALSLTQPKLPLERWQQALRNASGPGRLAAALAADINQADDNIVFILEPLEHLTESSARWLEAFIRGLGEGHQVMASHYGDVNIDMSRFIASGEAHLITTKDLAFSLEETRELLGYAGSPLEPQLIHEELGGWPAALGMVAHGVPLNTSPKDLVAGLLKKLPSALRSTLPEAAVLEVWSEASARRLGCDLPPVWLRTVRRYGLPLLPLGNDTYRPHGLVLEVLEAALQQRHERCAELHLVAARDARSQGQFMFALHHLLKGDHHRQALDHVGELLPRWEGRSDWVLVRKVLESFPPEHLPPSMKTSLGIALLETGEPAKGEVLLREQICEGEANGMTYFGMTLSYYRRGQGQETVAWADAGLLATDDERATVHTQEQVGRPAPA